MLKTWTAFDRKIIIKGSLDDIYRLWATPAGITSWFLRSAEYTAMDDSSRDPDELMRAGDRYVWKWHNWDGQAAGEIISTDGRSQICFSFEDSVVEVILSMWEDGRVLVSLQQRDISEDDQSKMNTYAGCGAGWTFWLTNLKAFVEHDILLNEQGDSLNGKFDGYQIVNT